MQPVSGVSLRAEDDHRASKYLSFLCKRFSGCSSCVTSASCFIGRHELFWGSFSESAFGDCVTSHSSSLVCARISSFDGQVAASSRREGP